MQATATVVRDSGDIDLVDGEALGAEYAFRGDVVLAGAADTADLQDRESVGGNDEGDEPDTVGGDDDDEEDTMGGEDE